jgi:hypothetical protein
MTLTKRQTITTKQQNYLLETTSIWREHVCAWEMDGIKCVQSVEQWEELGLMYKCVTNRLVGKMFGRVEGTDLNSIKRQLFWGGVGWGIGGNTSRLNVVSIHDTKQWVPHGWFRRHSCHLAQSRTVVYERAILPTGLENLMSRHRGSFSGLHFPFKT